MTEQHPPKTFPNIQGRCPACRGDSLFIGTGGHVTCSRIDCPNPSTADELLHGEHVTAGTPLVCSDERHTAKVADLEQQLARLREGEEPVTNPAVMHTPAQWIWRWNRATLEQRLQVVEAVMRDGAEASDCRINGHKERIHDGRHAEMALNEVRQVVNDMAAQGALQWAGWLRDAMKRGPKHCLLCATEPKAEPACTCTGTDAGLNACAGCPTPWPDIPGADRIRPVATEATEPGDIQITRKLGHGLIVDHAPPHTRMALAVLANTGWGARVQGADCINIGDQVLYRVTGYDPEHAALLLDLVEDWRPAPTATVTEAEYEELKARWLATYGNNQGAHPVVELRPTGEERPGV